MATDSEVLICFKMPSSQTVTGRSSTIRNAFVAAITPVIQPTVAELREVLTILGMEPSNLRCSYCGDAATEWDHLRPLVTKGRPTGYPSSIKNLVPACGKCNQSKGKQDWKTWMLGRARMSPRQRGIKDVQERIKRLEVYERWAGCSPADCLKLADADLWARYYQLQAEILEKMRAAQVLAVQLKKQMTASLAREASKPAQNVPQLLPK